MTQAHLPGDVFHAAALAEDLLRRLYRAQNEIEHTRRLDRAVWTLVMSNQTFERIAIEFRPLDHPRVDFTSPQPKFWGFPIVIDDNRGYGAVALRAETELA